MSTLQIVLMVALPVLAFVHARSRLGSAIGTVLWAAGAIVMGARQFAPGDVGVTFLRVPTPKWLFFGTMAGLMVFNVAVVLRAIRRPRPSSSSVAAGTGPGRAA